MAEEPGPASRFGPGSTYLRPELRNLKIIGVEEHTTFPALMKDIPKDQHGVQVFSSLMSHVGDAYPHGRLNERGAQRLKDMDEGGIALQILSFPGPVNSTHLAATDPAGAVKLAQDINNSLKEAVEAHPTRYKAMCELPMHSPADAVTELHRCITELGFVGAMFSGSVASDGTFLDAPHFAPLLSAFEDLDVPLYLHPGVPPKPVWDTYYSFPDKPQLSATFSLAGWGWHNDTAIHVLRLALSGTLDRHPRLKIVIGHQGEMMPMMMQRMDTLFDPKDFGFSRTVGEMLRAHVWIAISGLFSVAPTQASIATWGVERVLFAVDYPFIDAQRVPDYLKALGDVVAPEDLRKICQGNAERLYKFKI
ncbi:hypothetical protein MMC14_009421 [Varicellaria rhodocarpa]|nr:hypothetical protein [Varicellaria rhodocarpa]